MFNKYSRLALFLPALLAVWSGFGMNFSEIKEKAKKLNAITEQAENDSIKYYNKLKADIVDGAFERPTFKESFKLFLDILPDTMKPKELAWYNDFLPKYEEHQSWVTKETAVTEHLIIFQFFFGITAGILSFTIQPSGRISRVLGITTLVSFLGFLAGTKIYSSRLATFKERLKRLVYPGEQANS
jgi:hypothetical protein